MSKIAINDAVCEISNETLELMRDVLRDSVEYHRDMYDLGDDKRLEEIETFCDFLTL